MDTIEMTRDIKKKNRGFVFRYISQNKCVTKKALVQALGISMPTLIQYIKELSDMQLIKVTGLEDSQGGRRPEIFSVNENAKLAIGLDVTRNHIAVIAVDLGINILAHKREYYPFENSDAYFKKIGDYVQEFVTELGCDPKDILGVGVSLPGILSYDRSRLMYGDVIDFNGGSLQRFRDVLPYPCWFSNDASAAGFAEFISGFDFDNAVYMYLSNSVGGSILIDGKLFDGNNSKSAEFGHMCIVPDGKQCYCGHRGCLNAYCNATVLAEAAGGRVEDFFRKLDEGDARCEQVWQEYKAHLEFAIRSLRTVFDADIIVGGYVGDCMGKRIEEIRADLKEGQLFEDRAEYVYPCRYRIEAAALGAALYFVQEYIESV